MFDKFKHRHLENYNQINEVPISRINTRIEAVNDPKVNKILFSLYEKMVEPYRRIEAKISRVNDLQMEIDENNESIKNSICSFFYIFFRSIIPVLILNFIFIMVIGFIFGNDTSDKIFHIIYPFYSLVITNETFLTVYCYLANPIIFAAVCVGLFIIIMNLVYNHQNEKNQKEIDELTPVINKEIYDLSEVSCYIPPDYRYSKALDFFVNAYSNSKVDNLKEAVNLFDTNEYRENMLYYQQKLCELQEEILYVELEQLNQLNSLSRDVWFSEVLF